MTQGNALRIDGGMDRKAAEGMHVVLDLDAEQAALVRVLMRERGALAGEVVVLDLIGLAMHALDARL